MPTARNQFGLAATADGRIYAIGGKYSYFNNEGPFFDVVEVYDPLAGAWETGPALSGPRGELGVALSGSTIYAAGGTGGAFVSLNEALARLNWLNVSPSSGSVAPSGGAHLDVAMDAAGLAGGDYFADITIATNDPDEIAVAVPVRLSVAGAPDVAVSARNLDFGRVYLGFEESQSLRIRNAGAQALEVAGIVVDDGDYSVSESAFILEPLASKDLSVRFAPSRLGLAPATLTVLSNDPLDPALIVSMSSEGRLAPKISLSPDSLAEAVAPGASRACTLTIANGGGSDLAFEIEMSERAAVAALGTTTLFSDDFEDGDLDGWFDTGGLGVKEVTDETAAVGTYSYHEYDSPGGHFTGIYQVFSPIQPGYIGFYVRAGSTTASAAYVVFLDGGGSDLIWFFARRTGFFYINADVDGDESFAYAVNIWYHVEFKEVDFAAKTFDYYVDGVLIKAGIPFRNRETVSAVGRLDLYNLDHGSEAWWDEINLAADQPPGWVSASPTEGVIAAGGSLDVSVTFDAGDLPVGTYEADLIVRSNDPRWPEAVVPVDLSISDRAEILVEPDSLRAVSPAGKARILGLKLGNAGIADLGFSVVPVDPAHSSEPPQWIAVTPSEGIVPGGGYADLRVRADARGLDVGLHEASLMIISNDQVRPVIYVGISLSVVSASPKPHDDSTPPDSSGDHAGVTDWVPTEFALSQSRPNPFSRSTAIVFDLPVGAGVTLDIYDVRGTRIATLVDDVLAAGRYSVTWSGQDESGADASPGVYFYRIRAGRWTQTRSALLIR
jgi:hypothetical protein